MRDTSSCNCSLAQPEIVERRLELRLFGILVFLFLALSVLLSGCMTLRIEAQAGSTVSVTNSGNKTVTVTTQADATIPTGALGL